MGAGQSIRAGRAFVELYADQSKLVRGLRKAEGELRAFGAKVQRIGRDMMMAAGMVAAPVALATKLFMAFGDEMAKVRAKATMAGTSFEQLTKQARDLGRTTSFTATEVASGMAGLAQMGFNSDEIAAATGHMLNLSRSTGTDLAEASIIAARAIRGFGLDASDTERVVDVLTATAINSAQTLTHLGESLGYATPIMKRAGVSIEDTAKSLGILANMGILGSRAGTSYQRMAIQIAKSDVQEKLRGMGIEALNAQKNLRHLPTILQEVGLKMASMGTGQQISLADTLFGTRAIGGALILGDSLEALQELINGVDDAGGTAKRTAGIMDDTLGGAFRMMSSAAQDAALSVGDALANEIGKLFGGVKRASMVFSAWIEQHKDLVVKVAAVAAGVGVLGIGLTALGFVANGAAAALGLVALAASGVSKTFTLMAAHPVVAAIAGIALVTAGLNMALNRLGAQTADLSDEMTRLRKAGDEQRASDLKRMGQLDALAKKEKLNSDEMTKAQKIIKDLTSRYGDLGVTLDSVSGKITGMADGHVTLSKKMRATAERQTLAEMAENERNQQAINEESQAVPKNWKLSYDAKYAALNDFAKQIRDEQARYNDLFRRLERLREGDPAALTGAPDGAGGVAPPSESAAAFAEKMARRLHDLKIANIKDEERREIESIKARYERERKDAPEGVTDFSQQERAEQAEIAGTQKKFAAERKQEEKQLFEDRAAQELQLRDENAHLAIDATKEGLDKELAHIELAKKRALADAAQAGLDPAEIERQYDLKEDIARKADAANRSGPEYTSQGSTSADAIAYFNAGQSGNPMKITEKNTKDTVKALQELIKQQGFGALRFT